MLTVDGLLPTNEYYKAFKFLIQNPKAYLEEDYKDQLKRITSDVILHRALFAIVDEEDYFSVLQDLLSMVEKEAYKARRMTRPLEKLAEPLKFQEPRRFPEPPGDYYFRDKIMCMKDGSTLLPGDQKYLYKDDSK